MVFLPISAFAQNLSAFIDKVISADTLEMPSHYSYVTAETVITYEDAARTERKGTIVAKKRYTVRGEGEVDVEIISMSVDGDSLPGKDKGDKNEGQSFDTEDMPFTAESRNDYDYRDLGEVRLEGAPARKIEFRSKKRSKNHIDGTAWFDPTTAYLRRLDFQYAKTPLGVKAFKASVKMAYRESYKYMSSFEMELRAKLPIIFELNMVVKQVITEIELL